MIATRPTKDTTIHEVIVSDGDGGECVIVLGQIVTREDGFYLPQPAKGVLPARPTRIWTSAVKTVVHWHLAEGGIR